MEKIMLKLMYRQVTDAQSLSVFERQIFNESYREMLIKSQEYNPDGQLATFAELTGHNPKANSLHHKVGLSVFNTVAGLNYIIPGLKDSLGRESVPFVSYKFEIIESNMRNQVFHKVAIDYLTPEFRLLNIISDYMILAYMRKEYDDSTVETIFMLKMRDGISVSQYTSGVPEGRLVS
jgi:hypothetical protein